MSECPNKCTLKEPAMVEIMGVYDGGLFWYCQVCKYSYHRWTELSMRTRAQPYIDAWNERNGFPVHNDCK